MQPPHRGLTPSELQLSLVLPAHNEAAVIENTVSRVAAALDRLGIAYELILGDSASTDGTPELVRRLNLPQVTVVSRRSAGKGDILTQCFGFAVGRYVGFIDSDLEIGIENLPGMLVELERGYDAVIGSKALDPTLNEERVAIRRLATAMFNLLARTLLGTPFADHQAGLKLFRREVMLELLPQIRSRNWLWDSEVLARLSRMKKRVLEVPVVVRPTRPSKIPVLRTSVSMFAGLFGLYFRLRAERR
jgi:glycosyltransferase involved in cell wall biosynthesis